MTDLPTITRVPVSSIDDEAMTPALEVVKEPRGASVAMDSAALGVTAALLLVGAVLGSSFWVEWFSSIDRLICTLFVGMGLFFAALRSSWQNNRTPRLTASAILWGGSAALLAVALLMGRPKLIGVAMGLAAAGWFCYQIRGESIVNALAMGMAFMIPSFVDACKDRGLFDASDSVSVLITSGLADAVQLSHIQEGNTIRFGHGVADRFACEGNWDSIVTFIGICVFCIYAYRRSFIAGALTLSLAFVVWMALRATACVAIAYLAQSNGYWTEWTPAIQVTLFFIGAALIFSLDQFISVLLAPIPLEHINADFPLFAVLWNWFVGLPKLSTQVPDRIFEVNQAEAAE